MEVSHFPHAPKDLLLLHAIDHFLDGGVAWPLFRWKRLLHLSDRRFPLSPHRVHNFHFKPGQSYARHYRMTPVFAITTDVLVNVNTESKYKWPSLIFTLCSGQRDGQDLPKCILGLVPAIQH